MTKKSPRDSLATILYLVGLILVMVTFESFRQRPFRWDLLLIGVIAIILAYAIGLHKFVGLCAALVIMTLRFVFVFVIAKDPRILLGGLISGVCAYAVFKLDPECSEPLDINKY